MGFVSRYFFDPAKEHCWGYGTEGGCEKEPEQLCSIESLCPLADSMTSRRIFASEKTCSSFTVLECKPQDAGKGSMTLPPWALLSDGVSFEYALKNIVPVSLEFKFTKNIPFPQPVRSCLFHVKESSTQRSCMLTSATTGRKGRHPPCWYMLPRPLSRQSSACTSRHKAG